MTAIKRRRLGLPLPCHAGDRVADYVPFYFCPRSVMLYLIHRGNHPELTYQGGQSPNRRGYGVRLRIEPQNRVLGQIGYLHRVADRKPVGRSRDFNTASDFKHARGNCTPGVFEGVDLDATIVAMIWSALVESDTQQTKPLQNQTSNGLRIHSTSAAGYNLPVAKACSPVEFDNHLIKS
jgi:hypothetical protein